MRSHDILVVGGGLAGMRAAIEADPNLNVAIISKVHPVRSHSVAAQGGINAALRTDDSWEAHAFDTVKGGIFLGDQDAIEIMCQEGPQDIMELEKLGIIFSRDQEGRIAQRPFGGQGFPRTCYAADRTGHALLHGLYERLLKKQVSVYEEWYVVSLVVEEGIARGIIAMDLATGELHVIASKAVIFATGGYGRVFFTSTNAAINTGDGMSMAYRAGVPLMDMEFVQFHPTTLRGSGILISEAARGEGAYLMNTLGERFMERYNPKAMELATRAEVSFAMQTELDEERGVDGCVLLDLRHLGRQKILERLPQIRQLSIDFAGIDPIESPIPVRPGAHYSMGGIESGVWGETRLPGFFAAGECACVSVHGANRLGGNSLLETIVFGRRSGIRASAYVRSVSTMECPPPHIKREKDRMNALLERKKGERIGPIQDDLGAVMNQNMGIFRTPDGMRKTMEKIRELKVRYQEVVIQDKGRVFNTELVNALELESLLDLTEVIVTGAFAREESRGSHYRRDYPQRDDTRWLRHTLAFFTSDGPRIDYKPVTITRHTPK